MIPNHDDKIQEKYVKIIKKLVAHQDNRYCFDCHQRGPNYVNVTVGSFVCTDCGGKLYCAPSAEMEQETIRENQSVIDQVESLPRQRQIISGVNSIAGLIFPPKHIIHDSKMKNPSSDLQPQPSSESKPAITTASIDNNNTHSDPFNMPVFHPATTNQLDLFANNTPASYQTTNAWSKLERLSITDQFVPPLSLQPAIAPVRPTSSSSNGNHQWDPFGQTFPTHNKPPPDKYAALAELDSVFKSPPKLDQKTISPTAASKVDFASLWTDYAASVKLSTASSQPNPVQSSTTFTSSSQSRSITTNPFTTTATSNSQQIPKLSSLTHPYNFSTTARPLNSSLTNTTFYQNGSDGTQHNPFLTHQTSSNLAWPNIEAKNTSQHCEDFFDLFMPLRTIASTEVSHRPTADLPCSYPSRCSPKTLSTTHSNSKSMNHVYKTNHLSNGKSHFPALTNTNQSLTNGKIKQASQLSLVRTRKITKMMFGYFITFMFFMLTRFTSMMGGIQSYFITHRFNLVDCIKSHFYETHLTGDESYRCDHCKKLTSAVKNVSCSKLPEVLCIYLKRFVAHGINGSKDTSKIDVPLKGLDMAPFVTESCPDKVTKYDLMSAVTHSGSMANGHYVCYAVNSLNGNWYMFNDTCVREIDADDVTDLIGDAYMLFYRKQDRLIAPIRNLAFSLAKHNSLFQPGLKMVFISRTWLVRFNTQAEPGPISNRAFLCSHGNFKPRLWRQRHSLLTEIYEEIWDRLILEFGGGPLIGAELECCQTCLDELKRRKEEEVSTFVRLSANNEIWRDQIKAYVVSSQWFDRWQAFAIGSSFVVPGPIDNKDLFTILPSNKSPNQQQHIPISFAWLSYLCRSNELTFELVTADCWHWLFDAYSGGPAITCLCCDGRSLNRFSTLAKHSSNNSESVVSIVHSLHRSSTDQSVDIDNTDEDKSLSTPSLPLDENQQIQSPVTINHTTKQDIAYNDSPSIGSKASLLVANHTNGRYESSSSSASSLPSSSFCSVLDIECGNNGYELNETLATNGASSSPSPSSHTHSSEDESSSKLLSNGYGDASLFLSHPCLSPAKTSLVNGRKRTNCR